MVERSKNLIAKAEYIDLRHMVGHTDRKIINYSPLHDNQNWLFEVIYDRAAFEINTRNYNAPVQRLRDACLSFSLFRIFWTSNKYSQSGLADSSKYYQERSKHHIWNRWTAEPGCFG